MDGYWKLLCFGRPQNNAPRNDAIIREPVPNLRASTRDPVTSESTKKTTRLHPLAPERKSYRSGQEHVHLKRWKHFTLRIFNIPTKNNMTMKKSINRLKNIILGLYFDQDVLWYSLLKSSYFGSTLFKHVYFWLILLSKVNYMPFKLNILSVCVNFGNETQH